jgi:hypothetical protein
VVGGDVASNASLPEAHRLPGVDTRQPRMDRATPTHPILERTTRKRKGNGSTRVAAEARRKYRGNRRGDPVGSHVAGEGRRGPDPAACGRVAPAAGRQQRACVG